MIALQLTNINKKYTAKERNALHDFTLEITKGEIHAIIGESGCGKTTLLRIVAGLETPDSGDVFINEKLVSGKSVFIAPEKRNIGFVFQDYALFPHLKVKENVGFGLNNISSTDRKKRIEKYLDLVGMTGYENRYPYELSGGQQQRISIARSLAIEPALLLLDEPFSNLDEILKKQMRYEIKEIITKAGTTAIFVTHDTNDALSVANKISVMKNGILLQSAVPESIYNNPVNEYVAKMFGTTNIMQGIYKGGSINTRIGAIRVNESLKENGEVLISIRPENIEISENGFNGIVKGTVFGGSRKELLVDAEGMQLYLSVYSRLNIKTGDKVTFSIKECSIINPG